jgi:hypothetical protein
VVVLVTTPEIVLSVPRDRPEEWVRVVFASNADSLTILPEIAHRELLPLDSAKGRVRDQDLLIAIDAVSPATWPEIARTRRLRELLEEETVIDAVSPVTWPESARMVTSTRTLVPRDLLEIASSAVAPVTSLVIAETKTTFSQKWNSS